MADNTIKTNLPIIDTNSITLKTDGKEYKYSSFKTNKIDLALPMIIAKGVRSFSTDSDPNISENELNQFKKYVYEEFMQIDDGAFQASSSVGTTDGAVVKDALLNKFDRLYDIYTCDNKIAPEEYTKMLKIMLDSSGLEHHRLKCQEISNDSEEAQKKTKSFWDLF